MTAMFQDLGMDVRIGFRMLRRQSVYALTSVLTLALAIGATTTVFAVLDATLFRPLPYEEPDRLVALNALKVGPDGSPVRYSLSQIEHVRWHAAHSFEYIESVEPRTMALTGTGEPAVIQGGLASNGIFRMLGAPPQLGRTYTAQEEEASAGVVVISDGFWRQRFGGDPMVLGRSLTLDGQTFEVIGVMPGGFHALFEGSDVWVPLRPVVDPARPANRLMVSVGRLRAGFSHAQAQQELAAISTGLATEFPATHADVRPEVRGFRDQLYGDRRLALTAIALGVLFLLVLASVNVVNLTYGHVSVRRKEFLIRAGVGAPVWRLVRLQVVQSSLIATLGGILGLWFTHIALPWVLTLNATNSQAPIMAMIDWRVTTFGVALVAGTGILTGAIPILRSSVGRSPTSVALSSGRVRGSRSEHRTRGLLVVAQISLAVALLCGANAFLASFHRLLTVRPGFSAEGVLSMQLTLAPTRYPTPSIRADFVRRVLERASAIPGVVAAGTTQTTFLPNQSMMTFLAIDGAPMDPTHIYSAHMRHITPGYFRALRVPIIEGRAFNDADRMGTPAVCMVSARFAKQFWPNTSAIGHQVRRCCAGSAPWMTVIGVVGDVMDAGLGVQQGPTLYANYLQINMPTARVSLLVRTSADPLAIARSVQQAIWSVDAMQPVDRIRRLQDVLVETTSDQRFQTVLMSGFAIAGLALTVVGVYGVTASAVKARTWDVGVRMALGASPGRVVSEMFRASATHVLIGTLIGGVMFLVIGRLLRGLLYNTSPTDPWFVAAAMAVVSIVSLTVIYWQARWLAYVSPARALRDAA